MLCSTRKVCAFAAIVIAFFTSAGVGAGEEFTLLPVSTIFDATELGNEPLQPIVDDPKPHKGKEYCCIGCCCDDPCACWTFYGGYLMLQRSRPDDAILFQNGLNPAQNFNANQFDFDYEPGFEVGAIKHNILPCHICGLDLEARFFMIDGWSDSKFFQTTQPPSTVVTVIGPRPDGTSTASLVGPRDINTRYDSELTSFELNLRRRCCHMPRIRWIAGVRALELDEQLFSTLAETVPQGPGIPLTTAEYTVRTRNRLYGFQLGAEVDLLNHCCWCLRGFGKGGIYNNEAGHDSILFCDPNFGPCAGPLNETRSRTAGLAELGLSLRYCWCECVTLRADYRAMWLAGVALASDQVQVSEFNTDPPSGIDTSGSVFYHGFTLGLEYRY